MSQALKPIIVSSGVRTAAATVAFFKRASGLTEKQEREKKEKENIK